MSTSLRLGSRSTGSHCAVIGCKNNYRRRTILAAQQCEVHLQPRRICMCKMFRLHRFPTDKDRRQLWIDYINRKDFTPSQSSRVCSVHFVGGERTINSVPTVNLGYEPKDASIVFATKGADATVESKGDTTRKKHRRRSKASEPGSQRRKAKKRVGDNRLSLTSSASSKLEEHTSPPLSANDDARTTGTSWSSPPKPSLDIISASGLSQEALKPPEAAAHLGVIPSAAALSLPTFAERSDVLTDGRGAETLPELDRQSSASKAGVTSSSGTTALAPGLTEEARRARRPSRKQSSAGFKRKGGPWLLNHRGLTAVVGASCSLLLLALLVIIGVRHAREGRPSVGVCETPGCRKHGYSLALTRDLNVSPCYDFYEYACGKWNRLYRLPIRDEMHIQAQIITYNELKVLPPVAHSPFDMHSSSCRVPTYFL